MEPKELRLGNWVKHQKAGELQVSSQDIHDLSIATNKFLSPIPLTEEWIEKSGCNYEGPYRYKITNYIYCRVYQSGACIYYLHPHTK